MCPTRRHCVRDRRGATPPCSEARLSRSTRGYRWSRPRVRRLTGRSALSALLNGCFRGEGPLLPVALAELPLRTWPSTWCKSSWWAPRCWAAPSPARCGRSSQPAKRPPRHAGGREPSPGPPPASPGSTCRKLSRSSTSPRSVRRRSRRTTSIYLR